MLGSLKVIGTDTDRSITYDFPLTFHNNHGPILYRFSDIDGNFCRKSHNFPTNLYFASPLPHSPPLASPQFLWNWVPAPGVKNQNDWATGRERSLTISLAVWIQSTNVTDRRKDPGRQQRPRLRVASRGKNCNEFQVITNAKLKLNEDCVKLFFICTRRKN